MDEYDSPKGEVHKMTIKPFLVILIKCLESLGQLFSLNEWINRRLFNVWKNTLCDMSIATTKSNFESP